MLLQLEHLKKHYETSEALPPVPILEDISLDVAAGETLAVVGPSGSGKSTLLNIIGTLDRPTAGKVIFDNRDLALLPEKELARLRNQEIGFIFQLHHLLPQCTVLENVLIPTLPLNGNDADVQQRAKELLKRVGLHQRMHYFPGQLSGGERQRTAVVRALINQPKLLLADEPTGSLDKAASDNLAQLLLELNQEQQVTLILVTHSFELARRMQQRYQIREGKLTKLD